MALVEVTEEDAEGRIKWRWEIPYRMISKDTYSFLVHVIWPCLPHTIARSTKEQRTTSFSVDAPNRK